MNSLFPDICPDSCCDSPVVSGLTGEACVG